MFKKFGKKIIVLMRAVKFLEMGAHEGLISKRGNTTLDGYIKDLCKASSLGRFERIFLLGIT
jgi:hypothetical protein